MGIEKEEADSRPQSYVNVCDHWFVRDSVNKDLDDKVVEIACYILDQGIDPDNAEEEFADCIQEFINFEHLTYDELNHVLESVALQVSVQLAFRLGIIEDCEGLIKLVNGL